MDLDPNAPVIYSERITINAPLPKVWEILSDIPNWPAWNPEVRYARLQGPVAPGTRFVWKARGARVVSRLDVVQVSRTAAVIGWGGKSLGIRAAHAYTLEVKGNKTLVRTGEAFDGLIIRLFKRFLQRVLIKTIHNNLLYLKNAAEKAYTGPIA